VCWWLDKNATCNCLAIKDAYRVSTFIETGTFRGVNLKFWSYHFKEVIGCELNPTYHKITRDRMGDIINYKLYNMSSPDFIREFVAQYRKDHRKDYVIFYLDAHFYDPSLVNKFVVIDELKALEGFNKAIIVIHDFDTKNGLGHITYDGVPLDLDLVMTPLLLVNKTFSFYRNTPQTCDPHTLDSIQYVRGIEPDEDTIETIKYHNNDWLKKRGLLYCLPNQFDIERCNH